DGKEETARPADGTNGKENVPVAAVPDDVPVPTPRAVKPAAPARTASDLATAVDDRHAARTAWLAEHDVGVTLSGKDLSERFGKSERWGRSRVTEARAELADRQPVGV